jgi:Domain of unknown function (DUF4815)
MPSYDPNLFNVNPYYDDFNEDKKFLRMLFRPGYSVQSRELTQLQTILQNQIERFGNNIFKDGSVIIGGQITTQTLNFVRLLPQTIATANSPKVESLSAGDLIGYNIIQRNATGDSLAKAKIVNVLPSYSDSDDYVIAVISYMSGNQFSAGVTAECDNPDKFFVVQTAPSSTTVPHRGSCKTVAVAEGVYYVDGFFVKTDNQLQAAYTISNEVRQFNQPTGSMGFAVKSIIVSEKEDYTLKDPASGSYNYNAPGSHRFKIELELTFSELAEQQDFVELVRYATGEVIKKFDQTQYPELVKLFAQRTYDERGNYIVKPFSISMREKDDTTLIAELGSGKAYVFGHEYESVFRDQIEVPKARSTAEYQDIAIQNSFENYVVGKYRTQVNNNGTGPYNTRILPLLNGNDGTEPILVYGIKSNVPLANYRSTGFSGAIFSARLHRMEFANSSINDTAYGGAASSGVTGTDMKAYLSDIQVYQSGITGTANQFVNLFAIDQVTGLSTRVLFDLVTLRDVDPSSDLILPKFNNFANQQLIFPLNGNTPTTQIKDVDRVSYVYTVYRQFFADASNDFKPSVAIDLPIDFKWCTGEGFTPGSQGLDAELTIDEQDEYYLVFNATATGATNQTSGGIFPGMIWRIRGGTPIDRVVAGFSFSYPTAKITDNGTYIKFTKALAPGSYTIIGKAKANNQNIDQNPINKIRTKTLTSKTETVSSSMSTIDTYKRKIQYSTDASNSIVSLYFNLDNADVFSINSITGITGQDILYKFQFDSGQRDSAYLLGRLYVKPKYINEFKTNETFTFTVNYSCFSHEGYGPFVKESYNGITYDNIPVFVSPTSGKSINLSNAIDFRPVETISGFRNNGSSGAASNIPIIDYVGGFIPSNYSISTDYIAYLPRIDKLVISRNIAADGDTSTLRRIPGIASDSPQIPEDLNESMTLSILSIPAYTFNPDDVKSDSIGNNRFTMKDIARMSKRVDELEQHAVLSDVESNVIYRDIQTSEGTDAIKRAVLVDTFDGHSIGDVLNSDYRCSIDIEKGELKPSFDSNAYAMEYVGSDSGITLTLDNILCESYVRHETPVVEQNKASSTLKVNPFGFPNWVGNMVIRPHGDFWYDKDYRPSIKSNDSGVNDAWVAGKMDGINGHGSQWNDWESLWTGLSTELTEAESKKNAEFFGKSREKAVDSSNAIENKWFNKLGISRETDLVDSIKNIYQTDFRKKGYYANVSTDTVINTSIVPYMRDEIIIFNAFNMKPGTPVHVFVDNVNMNDLCYRIAVDGDAAGGTVYMLGTTYANGATGFTGPFVTDSFNGSLTNVILGIPRGLFEVGEKIIRVIDDPNNDVENATTVAEAVFYCGGIKQQNTLDVQSIRSPEIRRQTPNSNKVVSTPLYRKKNINTIKYNNWVDPMSQTFEISDDLYPNGMYAESVDLYFASIDPELPVTISICPVINGLPHTSVVLPFSTVVKNPYQLVYDPSTPKATTFKFSTPVFLAPGEYAIMVHTNSTRYSVFVASIGEVDMETDERISSTLSKGSLFKSQNNSESSGDNNTDLMFKLYRCQFSSNTNGIRNFSIQTIEDEDADPLNAVGVLQPNLFMFTPEDVTVTSSQLGVPGRSYPFNNSRNLSLIEPLEEISDTSLVTYDISTKNTSNGVNTFMVDMDRTNLIAISYIITDGQNSRTVEENPNAFRPRRKKVKRGAFGLGGLLVGALLGFVTFGAALAISTVTVTGFAAPLGLSVVTYGTAFNTLAAAIGGVGGGVVGAGLTRRGRKKWTYGKKLLVPDYTTNPLEEQSLINAESDNTARYITRSVQIPNGLRAKELKVYFDANIPNSASVKVYAKTIDSTQFSKEIEENPYQLMTEENFSAFVGAVQESQTSQGYSVNEYDYREAAYSIVPDISFNTFVVKIVMYTTNETRVPTIKNLRIVAVE